MTKKDEKELDKTIELLENDDLAEEYDQAFLEMIERLCNMDDKDYRRFTRICAVNVALGSTLGV